MIAVLRSVQMPVSTAARGMIYNASVADLIRMLSLVKAYAQQSTLLQAQPLAVSHSAVTNLEP